MKEIIILIFITFSTLSIFSQTLQDGQKRWSEENKLTVDDFKIKTSDDNNELIYSQFMISHYISGFDFMKKI